jgi:hypothetical protein
MKNLLNTVISLAVGAGLGSASTYYLTSNQSLMETMPIAQQRDTASTARGTDKYEIRWYGKPTGKYFYGNYSIIEMNKPIRVESIPKSPHIVKLTLPKGAAVAATGDSTDIKIFKNGKECGQIGVVGTGISMNKTCS